MAGTKNRNISNIALLILLQFPYLLIGQNLDLKLKAGIKQYLLVNKIDIDSAFSIAEKYIFSSASLSAFKIELSDHQKQQVTVGIEILTIIASEYDEKARLYSLKGLGYRALKEFEKAALNNSIAIRINPKDPLNYRDRALNKISLEDYYGAINDLTTTISIKSDEGSFFEYRAKCYLFTEQHSKCISDASRSLSMRENSSSYVYRALSYIAIDRKIDGCTDLSRAADMGYTEAFKLIKEFCSNN